MSKNARLTIVVCLLAAAIGWFAWDQAHRAPAPTSNGPTPPILASFYPVGYFTQQITDGDVPVEVLTPGGVEPHDFEPSPQAIVSVQTAGLFFYNGASVDVWASKLRPSLPSSVTAVNILQELQANGVALRQAQPDEEGSGDDTGSIAFLNNDPHVWLDPVLAQKIVDIIATHVEAAYPDHAATFATRADNLKQSLAQLDSDYAAGLAHCQLPEIIVSHDAFRYLADRYHFAVDPINGLSPDQQPSAKHLGELADLIKQKGMKIVFFETLASPRLSQTLAQEAGAQSAVLDPIEGVTPQEVANHQDYMTIMRSNLDALRSAMQCQ